MNSNVNWVLHVSPKVRRELGKISRRDRARIIQVIESLAEDPFAGDIEKMKDEVGIWRRRVGNYRIFYEPLPTERLIRVLRVKRRTSSTY